MRIEQRVIGPCITNVYLLISEKNNAVLIDPADDADQINEGKWEFTRPESKK